MGYAGPSDNGKGHHFTGWIRCDYLPAVPADVQEHVHCDCGTWMRNPYTNKSDLGHSFQRSINMGAASNSSNNHGRVDLGFGCMCLAL